MTRTTNQTSGPPHGPHPERVSESYAEERILEKIARFESPRQREGLANLNNGLKENDVPPAMRLHLMTAVANLSRIGQDTLVDRVARKKS